MPPLPSPGQVVKLVLSWQQEDATAENILYFQYTGSGSLSVGELTNFMESTEIASDLLAPFVGASVSSVTAVLMTGTDLSSNTGVTFSFIPSFTGTNTGASIAASQAVCVSHEIARRYRGGHPRTYMMVGSASDFETASVKFWQASFLTNIQNGWNAFVGHFPFTIGARTWSWVNVSFYETVGGVRTVRTTPLVDPIIATTARDRVCSQRRRLGKVGG
jgi:hypothetical protein